MTKIKDKFIVFSKVWLTAGNSGTTAGTDFIGTTDAVDFVIKTNSSESLRVKSGGNVGIAWSNPSTLLQIFNVNSSTTIGNSRYIALNNNGSINKTAEIGFGWSGTVGAATTYQPAVVGGLNSSAAGLGTVDVFIATRSVTTDTAPLERMRVTAAGNVGINNVSPNAKLDVTGDAIISTSLTTPLIIGGSTATSKVTLQSTTGTGTTTADAIVFNVGTNGGTSGLRINNSAEIGLNTAPITGVHLVLNKNITGATATASLYNRGTIQSDVTASHMYFQTRLSTQATSFTLTDMYHYYADCPVTLGAGSSITNNYGFYVTSTNTRATNNYAFYGNIASGSNRYNLYMNGTAANYLAGILGIGIIPVTGQIITTQASGATSATYSARFRNSTNAGDVAWIRDDGTINANDSYYLGGSKFIHSKGSTDNVFVGLSTASNPTGTGTVGIGNNVMPNLSTGSLNVGIGNSALNSVSTGSSNLGIGSEACVFVTTGNFNVGVGENTLRDTQTVSNNTAIGYFAGRWNFTGHDNVFVGYNTGNAGSNTDSNNGVFVGSGSGANGAGLSNILALGAGASVSASNTFQYGNGSVTDHFFTGNINTSQPSANGKGAWKLGKYLAATVVVSTTNYVEVMIDGTLRKLAIVT